MGADATSRHAEPAEIQAMVQLVEQSLSDGALGFSSSLGEGHLDGDGHPVPSSAAAPEEFVALAGALRNHPGTTLEFIPVIGPIPDDRMELMAEMSLAADRPLNWNLLGSLASEEIYEQQLGASDLAAERGANVVALALPDLMRMRASTLLPGLPGWREVLTLDPEGRLAAVADPELEPCSGQVPRRRRLGQWACSVTSHSWRFPILHHAGWDSRSVISRKVGGRTSLMCSSTWFSSTT